MRLIGSVYTPEAVLSLVQSFESHKIAHNIDPKMVTDWGSPTYGDRSWVVWIINEEDLPLAQKLYEDLITHHDPLAPKASIPLTSPPVFPLSPPPPIPELSSPEAINDITEIDTMDDILTEVLQPPLKIITALLMLICLICFTGSYLLTNPTERGEFFSTPLIPTDPIKRTFLFDFPPYYEIVNQFLQSHQNLTEALPETKLEAFSTQLHKSFQERPVWQGYYNIALAWLKNQPWQEAWNAPRFEKIGQGEVWRLITPIFLHQNLLHILFNLLWVYILGRQLEVGLGSFRYLLFCVIVAVASNTAQYLVSGPNFLGISGLVCGMVTFIWVYTRYAQGTPHAHTYFLSPGTFQGLSFFVGALLGIQILSFVLETTTSFSIPVGVANTAHLSGALTGALLAWLVFPKKHSLRPL